MRRRLHGQIIHRLAAPRPKQTSADPVTARHLRYHSPRSRARSKNLRLLIRRPIPTPPATRDHLNSAVLNVLRTVLMPAIRTVIIHNITSPKFRVAVSSK
jgi:hypothetical protein